MPNWVENYVTLKGDHEQIHELLDMVKDEQYGYGTIDFNKVIPMPDVLNIEAGSRTEDGFKAYSDFMTVYTLCGTINMDKLLDVPPVAESVFLKARADISPEVFELGKKAYQNKLLYGAKDWYNWCNQNWNTKWNACGYESGLDYSLGNCLHFQTAWSPPVPIIEKLAEQFPGVEFVHSWANEDLGMSCGRMVYQKGKVVEEYYPTGEEARSFANAVWGYEDEREANDMKLEELT